MGEGVHNMSKLVSPHGGGGLEPRLLGSGPNGEDRRAEALERAAGLKAVPMTSRETSDLVMLAMGAYTPLDGFMGFDDWRGTCVDMKLSDGTFWRPHGVGEGGFFGAAMPSALGLIITG